MNDEDQAYINAQNKLYAEEEHYRHLVDAAEWFTKYETLSSKPVRIAIEAAVEEFECWIEREGWM
jgi:hypothetical protein